MIDRDPSVLGISKIPKCYGSDCITIGVGYTSPETTRETQFVLNYLAEHQNLEYGKDIQVIGTSYNETLEFLGKHPNKTQTAVLFCTGQFVPPENPYYNKSINCFNRIRVRKIAIYSLLINTTITPLSFFSGFNTPEPVDYASLSVKVAIDEALLTYYSKEKYNSSIYAEVQSFPTPTNR